MPTPLSFKGDKKPKSKKRKLQHAANDPTSDALIPSNAKPTDDSSIPIEEDDTWVSADAPSDLAGPVIIILPSEPPSCVASDANGTVFALPIENIVEGNPETAEPHDVRQVWVASRLSGTGEAAVNLKGAHGRYLGVDKFGILSATREAISPEEQFTVLPSPDTPGTFALQTRRDKFVCISAPTTPIKSKKSNTDTTAPPTDIRGDADTIDFNSTLRIRMQARFKPRNRAHKEAKAREKISRKELEEMVGRKLQDEEVRKLKRARREGDFHEMVLDARTKGKHDKFA